MTEILSRSAGRLWLPLVRSGVATYGVFARRKGGLGKLILVRVLVVFREQSSKEFGMQPRSVLVIDGDLGRTQGLDQATNQVEDLRLVVGFHKPREFRP